MELIRGNTELEALNSKLNDDAELLAYKKPLDTYRSSLVPRLLGHTLVWCGNATRTRQRDYARGGHLAVGKTRT